MVYFDGGFTFGDHCVVLLALFHHEAEPAVMPNKARYSTYTIYQDSFKKIVYCNPTLVRTTIFSSFFTMKKL